MNITTAKQILTTNNPANLYDVVQPALQTAGIRDLLVEGSFAKPEMVRYNCVRVLARAMHQRPELFYPYWEYFESRLDSPGSFHRSFAAEAIALLSSVDKDCRLDQIFKRYLGLLDDPKPLVIHYFILTLSHIYRARVDLRNEITNCLLRIDKSHHRPDQQEALKADVIGILEEIFEISPEKDKKRILTFVRTQVDSSKPKTRKTAKQFLKRHS